MKGLIIGAVAGLATAIAFGSATPALAQNNVLFIFDASGSMRTAVGNDTRISIAKRAMESALKDVPAGMRLGLLMYGHRRANDCTDIEMVSPVGADDAAKISATIQAVQPKGETPIAEALRQAARNFASLKGQSNSIVLVTDGIEECKGDPCAAAKEIKDAGLDLKVHVVGFTLNDAQRKAIQCVPDVTGGKYFEARDAGGLNRALGEVKQQAAAAPPPAGLRQAPGEDNLLSPRAGGRLLVAPNEEWIGLTDGKREGFSLRGSEGVWAFKDGKPATFDSLEVLIPQAGGFNPKDVELLVGDEGPLGTFRSLGELTVQNSVAAAGGWQKFAFPPVTARFFKIVFKTNWDSGYNYINGYEIKVAGKIDEVAQGWPKPAAPAGVELLSPANGGALVVGRNVIWQQLNSGKPAVGQGMATYAGEGVWRFKDGKPARFDRVDLLLPDTHWWNVKEFEVLAGDEGPAGAFRSLGTFTTNNVRMVETEGWQAFAVPATTARFVKIAFKTPHGTGDSYVHGRGVRVYGTVDEAAAPAAPAPKPQGIDLIAASNGGALLSGGNDEWKMLNTGEGKRVATRAGSEGVWTFKGEKPAKLNAVQVLIPTYESYNVREFEVLASADGPTGPFTTAGTFTTINGLFPESPWQTFMLPGNTARYVKVVAKSSFGDSYVALYGVKVFGTPDP